MRWRRPRVGLGERKEERSYPGNSRHLLPKPELSEDLLETEERKKDRVRLLLDRYGILNANPVAVQIPVGQGPPHFNNPFRGVIDLISLQLLKFDPSTEGKHYVAEELPAELRDDALMWRDAMLEKLYGFSDELAELALAEQPIPPEVIHRALRQATLRMEVQHVFCGSALHGIGVQPVLDGVVRYLPSPADLPAVEGRVVGKRGAAPTEQRRPLDDEPFCGLVFKVLPAKTGDMSWVCVYSGTMKGNMRALNPANDKKENISQLWLIHATKREQQIDGAAVPVSGESSESEVGLSRQLIAS